ncbi:selenocysteine-specific translation elongation factor [Marinisporobacter balticus]|uniref:Selenocysteine-specific elongation factor n=1 Tax=Marinisporobacter balticus TaxID=2018667 RepID=A0A4R2L6Y7_9FIRM|nr:selenocysteine-specific translation elongation factor [Marinisporobacter balticus]TCO79869.1 selenocysteine-specific translation elongation factor SelB [Marinisporobacter balticus]
MKHIIIGTAGHIDHGKTTLIKALTGVDADRLKEEKKRGITIELGFAHFDLPSGKTAGIIDVPGHEKFIKNMLAGVGGIDIVLLVVAADEGIMPQTQEHLDILSILEVKKGIIVLTKTDLVEKEWLELVQEEIKERVQGTFLEKASIMPVSATNGEGIEELTQLIDEMTEQTEAKDRLLPFRMPIDRVFTISGFGTVVTGTQIEGTINEGDAVKIYPQGIDSRVRNLQVHDKNVKTSYAGQRVAINLANIKKEDIQRGNVLVPPDAMQSTMMLDVKINLLKNEQRVLENRSRLRVYHGSSEILCRIVLLDREELNPGESCYAQLRLEEETVAKRGDHIVIRFYSPMETIGGGIVLEPNPVKHKRYREEILNELKIKEQGSPEQILEEAIKRFSDKFENTHFYGVQTGLGEDKTKKLIALLIQENKVIKLLDTIMIHKSYLDGLREKIINTLSVYHKNNPLKSGMSKEELRNKIVPQAKSKLYDEIMDYLIQDKVIKQLNKHISLYDFNIVYTPEQEKIKSKIEKMYFETRFNTPSVKELMENTEDERECTQVLYVLIDMNRLVKINEDFLIHIEHYHKAIALMKNYVVENGSITLSQFRDLLGTTRKYALPLLDYFDQNKITKRVGEKRTLL